MVKKLIPGDIYAVHTGAYAGEMLIFIEEKSVDYCFLSIPKMVNRAVPKVVFDHGRNNNILRYVERAPGYAFKTSKAQYVKNENTYNRRKQSSTSDVLDSEKPVAKNQD